MAGVLTSLRGVSDGLLDLFFPPACAICQAPPAPEMPVCARCCAALTLLPDPVCARCRAFVPEPHRRCLRGHRRQPGMVWSLGLFDDYYRELIHLFKFDRRLDCGEFLARRLGSMLREDVRSEHVDLVIPVPLHRTRQRERGFNQSALLADHVAQAIERPLAEGALKRIRNTSTQTALDYPRRRQNVAGAFSSGDATVKGQIALLVDDVMTTGATLAECASVLKAAGAKAVYGAVAALAMVDS